MDIGAQQRVIIVELEPVELPVLLFDEGNPITESDRVGLDIIHDVEDRVAGDPV